MNEHRQFGKQALKLSLAVTCVAFSSLLLVGCNKSANKPASQVAAKVNAEELTVHQINLMLEGQRALKPEQAEEARKQALERLIDQELAIQKAAEIKLDRTPQVVQKIEAARREIIARAYLERVGEGATKPSDTMIHKYYSEHPALFAERRIYQLQEWIIEVGPERRDAVQAKAQATKDIAEFSDYLRGQGLRFDSNHVLRAAEQLPMSSLPAFSKMNDGDTVVNARPSGLHVIRLVSSRLEPVEVSRVRPAIEHYLLNEMRSRLIADDLKALRGAAKIEYVGSFAGGAAAPASAPAPINPTTGAQQ